MAGIGLFTGIAFTNWTEHAGDQPLALACRVRSNDASPGDPATVFGTAQTHTVTLAILKPSMRPAAEVTPNRVSAGVNIPSGHCHDPPRQSNALLAYRLRRPLS